MDQKEFLQQIKQAVLAHDPDAQVILFGSRARGNFRNDSDWDILILTEKKTDAAFKGNLIGSISDIELAYAQAISPIIVEKSIWEDWAVMPLYKTVSREGLPV